MRFASMSLCNKLHKHEPYAHPALKPSNFLVCLAEGLEDLGQKFFFNSYSRIFHDYKNAFFVRSHANPYPPVLGSKFSRVIEQVHYHLINARRVAVKIQ